MPKEDVMTNPSKLDEIAARAFASPGCNRGCLDGNCVARHDRLDLVAALRSVMDFCKPEPVNDPDDAEAEAMSYMAATIMSRIEKALGA